MTKFEESNFYKALQDFFINADKKTFLQFLAEFYNRTEGIIDKDNIQDDLIKELRELYLEFNEKGIDENIVREKVNYFLENSLKIKDINSKLNTNTNNIKNINSQLDSNVREIANVNQNLQKQIDNRISKNENNTITTNMLSTELLEQINGGSINVNVNSSMIEDYSVISSKLEMCNLDVKCTHFGDFPNYDSVTKTLTFNSSCRVYWGNVGAYEIASGTTVINSVGGPWIKLVFNTVDNSLRFVDDWVKVGTKEIAILIMARSLKNSYGMDITIDGSYKKPVIKPTETEKQYFQTLEYAKLQNGLLDKKPILDIKNKTLYFHKSLYDVGFIVYGQTIGNVISKNGLLFKFNNSLSGTLKYLLLNTETKEIIETNTLNGYYAPTYCILLSFTMTTDTNAYINKFVSEGAFEVEVLGYTSQNNLPCNDTFINELNAPFRLISHRGWNSWNGELYPEQVISSYKESYKRGLRNVECDVKFTSDGIPVLLHDNTINRTARNLNGSELETDVYLRDLTYEQVRNNYDFGIYQGERFKGTKIPTLEELLRLCKILGMRIILEYKADENGTVGVNEGVEKVYNLVKDNGMLEYVVFLSGNQEVWNKIDELNTTNKSLELQYLDVPSDTTNLPFVKSFKDKGYKVGYSVGREWINENHANMLKENEIDLYIWTREFISLIDVETFEQWLNWNVKGITSNTTNIVNFAYNFLY